MTMKALQENPGHVIVEIGLDPDFDQSWLVNLYPWLREYYTFLRIDELPLPPMPMGPEDKMPLYLLQEGPLAGQLRQKLPPTYVAETFVVGLSRDSSAWLFKPTKRARPRPGPS